MSYSIYFLLDKKQVVYIGCTMAPDRRINEHKLQGKKFDSSRVIKSGDFYTARRYENRWISRFRPKYNLKGLNLKEDQEVVVARITKNRLDRLRAFAAQEHKTISSLVENALEKTYGL